METPLQLDKNIERAIEEGSPDAFIEAMKDAPPEQQIALMRQFSMTIMSGQFSSESRIASKITPEHITNYLDASKENMLRAYQERREGKILLGGLVLAGLIAFGVFIVLLRDNPDVMEKVLYAAGSLVCGALGGYGYGKSKRDE